MDSTPPVLGEKKTAKKKCLELSVIIHFVFLNTYFFKTLQISEYFYTLIKKKLFVYKKIKKKLLYC